MDYATMTKDELRTACKDAGIAYGKLSNEGMRAALTAAAPVPQPEPSAEEDTGPRHADIVQPKGVKIEKDRQTRNGVTRPSAGGKCRAVWDALDVLDTLTIKRVRELAAEHGWDKTTAQVQFYRWRKFNDISGR